MLEPELLAPLRRLVRLVREEPGLPWKEMVELAGVRAETGVTVDFDAAEELGHPLVVLRPRQTSFDGLSRREREVATLVARGLSNKEIADRLSISVATVKDHVHHVLEKTGLRSRTELAASVRT